MNSSHHGKIWRLTYQNISQFILNKVKQQNKQTRKTLKKKSVTLLLYITESKTLLCFDFDMY